MDRGQNYHEAPQQKGVLLIILLFTASTASLIYFYATNQLLCLATPAFLNTGLGRFALTAGIGALACASLASVLPHKFRRTREIRVSWTGLSVAFLLLVGSLLLNMNRLLDNSPMATHLTTIEGTTYASSLDKNPTTRDYYFRVRSWDGSKEPVIVSAEESDYRKAQKNMRIKVFTKSGYFGMPWIAGYKLVASTIAR